MASNGKMDFKLITDIMSRRVQLAKNLEEGNAQQRRRVSVKASNTQNTHLNFILLRLTDLSNTIHNCVEKCLVCDEFIQKLREHIIQTHGVTKSSQSNSTNTSTSSADIFTFQTPIPKTEDDDSYLPENRIPSDDLDDKDSTNSILDPPVNHFSLIVQNLKEEEEDSLCEEDPLLDLGSFSNTNSTLNDSPSNIMSEASVHGGQSARMSMSTDNQKYQITSKTPENGQKTLTVYTCAFCGLHFASPDYLATHHKTHLLTQKRVKRYECDLCDESFDLKANLNVHRLLHTGGVKRYKCEICGKDYDIKQSLDRHKLIHTRETQQFKCIVCEKSFQRLTELNNHKRIHTERTPYKCDQCGKSFALELNLKQHKLGHTGLIPYACHLCPKKFSSAEDLSIHVFIHKGRGSKWKSKFRCETCGNCFFSLARLNRHKLYMGEKNH